MKLLIVAGPYEADQIRRAAVTAGFEAVAVEPGESLSGWIVATRPDVIILAPQIINPDPVVALAKVRAVPRGRVPIFLVGEPDEEAQFLPLADGFFVRPISADALLAKAHDALTGAEPRAAPDQDSGPQAEFRSAATQTATRPLKPLVAAKDSQSARDVASHDAAERNIDTPAAPVGPARVSLPAPGGSLARLSPAGQRRGTTMFTELAGNIEADFDAEIRDVIRTVDALRGASASHIPSTTGSGGVKNNDAVDDLRDESGQKTVEVPHSVSSALAGSERPATVGGGTIAAGLRSPLNTTREADEIDLDLPSLLARVYLSRLSGRLTLMQGKISKYIVFERGHPVLAGSTVIEDRMGEMLVRQGRFTAAEMSACGAEVGSSGRRLGVVLVERGLLKATDLSVVVRRHYEEIIYSLFAWDRGAWNLGTDNSAAAEKILLSQHPAALILEGIRRKYGADRSAASLGGADVVFRLRLTTGAADLLEKMETTSEERNLVLLFDGVRSLRQIQALTRAPAERLYGVAWALFVLERLHLSDVAAVRETSGVHAPSVNGLGDELSRRDETIDRSLVMTRHALVMEGDYFKVLGVSRDASTQEIFRAHEILASELIPDVLHPAVVADLATELVEIRAVLAEAARLLADERLRQRYRDHLPPLRAASPDVDAAF